MATRQEILAADLTTDPLGRGYVGMTDQQAADDLNTSYRDADIRPGALFDYLSSETAKDIPADTATVIYGRLKRVDQSGAIGASTFGADPANSNLTDVGLDACRTLLAMADQDRLGAFTERTTKIRFKEMLEAVKDAGVMKPSDVSAIVALSQNQQTRGQELGVGRIKEGHVAEARKI